MTPDHYSIPDYTILCNFLCSCYCIQAADFTFVILHRVVKSVTRCHTQSLFKHSQLAVSCLCTALVYLTTEYDIHSFCVVLPFSQLAASGTENGQNLSVWNVKQHQCCFLHWSQSSWLVGWLASQLVGWLACRLAGWSARWSAGLTASLISSFTS